MAQADRISRKTIRQPDEFQELTVRATSWLRTNQTAVVGAASAIAIVVAIVLTVNWNASRQSAAAAVRFDAARAQLEVSNLAAAASEFQGIAEEFPRTPTGRLAMLYRGHTLARQNDYASAATAYSEYLISTPASEYLRQEALLGLARAKEGQSDQSGALDAYREAADVPGPFRTPARLALARILEASGDVAAATAVYAELATAPDLDAESRLRVTNRIPPVAPNAAP